MASKEIITLQLGHYANFVGTHWWNIQESTFQYGGGSSSENGEEIDHDVLFREGETTRGETTFTPRLVLTELKGGLRSLRSNGVLYDEGNCYDASQVWHGTMDVHKQPQEKKNHFLMDLDDPPDQSMKAKAQNGVGGTSLRPYNLENDVRVWSDYLRTYLHPKSMVIINEYNHGSETDPFDLWTKGVNLKNTPEELEERVRFYAEECDLLQGFHILADSVDGFAGLASSTLQHLHDEFSSKQLAMFPVHPARFCDDSRTKSCKRDLNHALLLPALLEQASLACPLSLQSKCDSKKEIPHLLYDATLSYHTSAILASALDSATLNHRLKGFKGINLDQFCDNATSSPRNLASLSLSLPVPIQSETICNSFNLAKFLAQYQHCDPWTCITPFIEDSPNSVSDYYSQCTTVRGVPCRTLPNRNISNSNPFSENGTPQDLLQLYLDVRFRGCHNVAYIRQNPLRTSVPYPQFFDKSVGQNGFLSSVQLEKYNPQNIASNSNGNNHVARGVNGHRVLSPPALSSQGHVKSVPVVTNMQCSSKCETIIKFAATCLQQSRKKHFSFHCMEQENLESDIECLLTMQYEYKEKDDTSDSDRDF